jgi:hypothetical protein
MRNGKVMAAPATTSFAQWQTAELGSVAVAERAALADPDKDGIPNLAECALGLAPRVPNAAGIEMWLDAGNRPRLRHYRAPSIAGVNLAIETSSALPSWGPAGTQFAPRSVTLMTDGQELVEWMGVAAETVAPQFTRLRAVEVP